jgi:selenide,water dikinase
MFQPQDCPDLMVGIGCLDDAAVYRLDSERALIFTTDFFTPVVDDPYDYGAIAAANALSDVYAMGGAPLLALNLAAFPARLPAEILGQVLMGMADMVKQAGAVVAGGHTIQDEEPKVGLCVAGMVHPDKLLTKGGVQPGDQLVLTKPLGTGLITTAAKMDLADREDVDEAIQWMRRLNRAAGKTAADLDLRGGTDVTGFGLLGHAWEMAEASRVTLKVFFEAVPFMNGVVRYADQGLFPGGTASNYTAYSKRIHFAEYLNEDQKMLLFDAQTSGGLLLAVPQEKMGEFSNMMEFHGEKCWIIGEAVGREAGIQVI